jgi:hypothetical protein
MGYLGKTLAYLFAALFLASLVTASSSVPEQAALSWNIQTVDQNRVENDAFMALDSHGTPYLAYIEYVGRMNSNMMFASWNGSGWNLEKVTQGFFQILDFKLDQNGNPYIVGFNSGPASGAGGIGNGLWFASRAGSNWTFQTVDQSVSLIGSLAIDSQGNPHIAYADGARFLKYASWTGTGWNIQTLEKTIGTMPVCLALDSAGNPRIMYNTGTILPSQTPSWLRCAMWDDISGAWNYQTVMANYSIVQLTIDSNDFLHFTSFASEPPLTNTIAYGSWNGSNWNLGTVISDLSLSTGGYFALDSNKNPHVICCLSTNLTRGLAYFSWNGSGWETQTIDSNATGVRQIVFDSSGNPHVCYLGKVTVSPVGIPTAYLMYARATVPIPTPTTSSSAHTNALIPTLTILAVVAIFLIIAASLLFFRRHRKQTSPIQNATAS